MDHHKLDRSRKEYRKRDTHPSQREQESTERSRSASPQRYESGSQYEDAQENQDDSGGLLGFQPPHGGSLEKKNSKEKSGTTSTEKDGTMSFVGDRQSPDEYQLRLPDIPANLYVTPSSSLYFNPWTSGIAANQFMDEFPEDLSDSSSAVQSHLEIFQLQQEGEEIKFRKTNESTADKYGRSPFLTLYSSVRLAEHLTVEFDMEINDVDGNRYFLEDKRHNGYSLHIIAGEDLPDQGCRVFNVGHLEKWMVVERTGNRDKVHLVWKNIPGSCVRKNSERTYFDVNKARRGSAIDLLAIGPDEYEPRFIIEINHHLLRSHKLPSYDHPAMCHRKAVKKAQEESQLCVKPATSNSVRKNPKNEKEKEVEKKRKADLFISRKKDQEYGRIQRAKWSVQDWRRGVTGLRTILLDGRVITPTRGISRGILRKI